MANRLEKPILKEYGSFMTTTLSKKSNPGDGQHGKGVRGECDSGGGSGGGSGDPGSGPSINSITSDPCATSSTNNFFDSAYGFLTNLVRF